MSRLVAGRHTSIILAVFLLLFLVLSYFASHGEPEEYPAYVSYSPAPDGVEAFYTYMETEGGTAGRWAAAPGQLPAEGGNVLLMIEPSFVPEQEEMSAYINFIEAGNTIILLQQNPAGIFGLETNLWNGLPEEMSRVTDRNGDSYQAKLQSPIRLEPEPADEVLLENEGGVIALKRSMGEGELIAATAPGWMVNEQILQADHLPLVISLLEESGTGSAVLFDEYIHGGENAPGVTVLYPAWLLVFMIQAAIFAIFWLWHKGKRFGPVITPREEAVRFSDERIQAVAAWYQRDRRYRDSLAIQSDYIKLLLQEKKGIPSHRSWTERTDSLKGKNSSMAEQELASFASGISEVLEKDKLTRQEYLSWSKKIDRLRNEVERG